MFGEGLARRLAPDEALHLGGRGRCLLGRESVLAGVGREIGQRELKLSDKTLLALGPLTVECPAQLLDHQLQGSDVRLGCRHPRLRCRKSCFEGFNVAAGRAGHGAGNESDPPTPGNC